MGLYWIRPATSADRTAIARIHTEAFGQTEEAQLVETLDREGLTAVSLIAGIGAGPVASIVISRVTMSTGAPAVCLAPLAVLPSHQRTGIGSALSRAGIEACRELGIAVIVVLGHPQYYPRFGFSAELGRKLSSPYSSHGDAWMALELIPSSIPDNGAAIQFPPVW